MYVDPVEIFLGALRWVSVALFLGTVALCWYLSRK